MKKGLIITLLVIAGLVIVAALVISAILELAEAAIVIVAWGIILLIGYLIFKAKT